MKKRIFAVFMTALVLLSALVVPCFAADENNPGGDVESPYYWFTLSVGQPIDLSVITEEEIHGIFANFVIRFTALDGKAYTNVAYTNEDWDTNELFCEVYPDATSFNLYDADYLDWLNVSLDEEGKIKEISTEIESGKEYEFDYVTVSFNTFRTVDGSTQKSSDNNIEIFLNFFDRIGIDLQEHKETTVFGVLGLMFNSVGDVVSGLGRGIRDGARNLIYSNGVNGGISSVVTFIFIIAGLSIAMTVFFMVWRLIRFKRQR